MRLRKPQGREHRINGHGGEFRTLELWVGVVLVVGLALKLLVNGAVTLLG